MNLSLIKYDKNEKCCFITYYIEENGDNSTNPPTLYKDAKWVAGPLPIDLPKTIMFFYSKLKLTY